MFTKHGVLCALLFIVCLTEAYARTDARSRINAALFRSYFKCSPCIIENCPLLPLHEGCIPIKERGICSCCNTCARLEHELCGIREAQCAPGLQCRPVANIVDEQAQFYSLLGGKARCVRPDVPNGKLSNRNKNNPKELILCSW